MSDASRGQAVCLVMVVDRPVRRRAWHSPKGRLASCRSRIMSGGTAFYAVTDAADLAACSIFAQ